MNLNDTQQPIYEHLPGESGVAYAAFKAYLELGDERSLTKVAAVVKKSIPLMNRWSARWKWKNRVQAWNNKIARDRLDVQRRAQEAKAAEWLEREQKLREDEWQAAERILGKIDQMLKLPVIKSEKQMEERTSEDGKLTIIHRTIVNPAKFDFGTAFRGLELASKLRRLATGMNTDKISHELPGGVAVTHGAQVVLYLPDNGVRMREVSGALPKATRNGAG